MSTEYQAKVLRTNTVQDTLTIEIPSALAEQLHYGDQVTLVVTEGR